MSRYLGQSVGRSGKSIGIYIAEQVKDKGYYRVVDAIDSTALNDTFERVQTVIQGKKILSTEQETKVESAVITSMDHKSESDANTHASVCFYDANGAQVCNAHVPKNPKKQERARDM